MKKIGIACFILAASAFSAAASAAPGEYWEITTKMEMPGMPFQMPASTHKVCIGKGNEKDPRQSSKDKDCEVIDSKISGNKTSWKMRCNRNGEVMTGSGEQTTTADSYQGTIHLSGKSEGRDMNMTQTYSGKRVGGSCDTEELAKQANKQIAQTCDLSGHNNEELINMADLYLTKGATCADKRDAMCSAIRKDAGSNAETYAALAGREKTSLPGSVSVSKSCGINMAAATKSICKTIGGKNYRLLSPYCPAEAKAYRVAMRKKDCEGRSFTAQQSMKDCMSGDDSDYTGDEESTASAQPAKTESKTSGDSASETLKNIKDNPAGAALEGAKKLKGLFGF
jgi:Protein of unknown function (DUF3617)